MDTAILEEFIEELKQIEEKNKKSVSVPNLLPSQIFVINEIIKLAEEKGIFPKTSFIAHMSLPNAASTKYKTDFYAPEFRFVMQHTLSEKMSFSYNLGSEWDGFSAEPTFIYTIATGYSINQKWGSYIELFGFAPQNNKANHNFDGGITYLINNNFMLDLSAGFGITNNAPKHYFALGFSFRI